MSRLAQGWDGQRPRLWINAGAGPRDIAGRCSLFNGWEEVRVDVDQSSQPDFVADITDLSPIPDGTADAVWSSHCLEHLYQHQVAIALSEFRRVITDDGFVVCLVPDIQSVAKLIAADQAHETVYQSQVGPVTAHDMFYGYGPRIAEGHTAMAHRCGLTPTLLVNALHKAGFPEFVVRRLANLELAVVARKTPGNRENGCEALIQALNL